MEGDGPTLEAGALLKTSCDQGTGLCRTDIPPSLSHYVKVDILRYLPFISPQLWGQVSPHVSLTKARPKKVV